MEERLNSDIGEFYATILKQRELAKQAAAASLGGSGSNEVPRPPEIRLGTISANRNVLVEFTNPMSLPSKEEFIKQNEENSYGLLNVFMLSGEDEAIDDNLTSWGIESVTAMLISINLEFDSPLLVS